MSKKRAPGGGRKPQGEFDQLTSPFSLRMPEDLRKQLEAASQMTRRSVSQEVVSRLNNSFGRDRDKDRDPAVRAISFLISELLTRIYWPQASQWHGNPFLFRAFKIGVAKLLDELEPKGEMMVPPRVREWADEIKKGPPAGHPLAKLEKVWAEKSDHLIRTWKSPSSVASAAVRKTLSNLYEPIAPEDLRSIREAEYKDEKSRGLFMRLIEQSERTWYGMSDVRRDLQLTKPEKANAKPKRISKPKS